MFYVSSILVKAFRVKVKCYWEPSILFYGTESPNKFNENTSKYSYSKNIKNTKIKCNLFALHKST